MPKELRNKLSKRRTGLRGESFGLDKVNFEKKVVKKDEATRNKLSKLLDSDVLFMHLQDEDKLDLVNAMIPIDKKKGEVIMTQGDLPSANQDYFYIISEGKVKIVKDDEKVAELGQYDSFGELALLYGQPRSATVVALTNVHLYAMDRSTYLTTLVTNTKDKRKMFDKFLKQVPILSPLTAYERQRLADVALPMTFKKGKPIVKQGFAGDDFYIIVEGKVDVYKRGPEDKSDKLGKKVNTLSQGQYFGEVALIKRCLRAATCVASTTKVRVLKFSRHRFTRMLGPCMTILERDMNAYKLMEANTEEMADVAADIPHEISNFIQSSPNLAASNQRESYNPTISKADLELSDRLMNTLFNQTPRPAIVKIADKNEHVKKGGSLTNEALFKSRQKLDGEFKRRMGLLERLEDKQVQLNNGIKNAAGSGGVASSGRATANFGELPTDTGREIRERHDVMGLTSDDIRARQQQILQEQDAGLDALADAISKQHGIASAISTEVDQQNDLLDEMAYRTDRVDNRLTRATQRINVVHNKASTCGLWVVILLLFIAIVVVAVIPV